MSKSGSPTFSKTDNIAGPQEKAKKFGVYGNDRGNLPETKSSFSKSGKVNLTMDTVKFEGLKFIPTPPITSIC